MAITLERNAKIAWKCQFYAVFLKVTSIMTAFLQGVLPVTRVLGSFGGTRPGFWEFCGKKLINRNHSRTEC